jgi:hypothetical protein
MAKYRVTYVYRGETHTRNLHSFEDGDLTTASNFGLGAAEIVKVEPLGEDGEPFSPDNPVDDNGL